MPALHHLALRTRDVQLLAQHYESVCKLPRLEVRDNGSVWLAAAGVVLMLEASDPDEVTVRPGTKELLAFQLGSGESLGQALARLEKHGVALEARTDFTLYFRDPDGRRNALSAYAF